MLVWVRAFLRGLRKQNVTKKNACLCGCAVLSQPEVVVLDPQDAVLAHQSNKKRRKMKRRAWVSDTRQSGARALVTLHVCARDL